MVVAASVPNTEILQFDWFISGRIFPVLPAQGENLKKAFLCRIKITIFGNIWSEIIHRAIKKRKVTMKSGVGEEISCEMTTKLHISIWRSVPSHSSIIFQ